MLLNNCAFKVSLAILLPFFGLEMVSIAQAQEVKGDGSLSTQVQSGDNLNFTITGGKQVGNNLFHSFENFSIRENGSASFANGNVQNIINLVTGNSISNINGLIQASGNANLLLINPNGVIFGRNASLDIGGSFLATTAEGLQFADGSFLNTSYSDAPPILTLSVPIGLQFGENPGLITNQSQTSRTISPFPGLSVEQTIGLKVQPTKTLALIGGEIVIDEGTITATEGSIELGSVAPRSIVYFTDFEQDFNINYGAVNSFQDIQISSSSLLDVTGGGGNARLQGSNVKVSNSKILGGNTTNSGDKSAGNITINASELVELTGKSARLFTSTVSSGTGGNIDIFTHKLVLQDEARIISTATEARRNGEIIDSTGEVGNITINAAETIDLKGENSLISTQTSSGGDAGDITINSPELTVQNTAEIRTESIGFVLPTGRQIIATGEAGNLTINAKQLNILSDGKINVSATAKGEAGSLNINAGNITLDRGTLTAETKVGDQGNITINNAETLLLRNNSKITTNATTEATGGNITITADAIAGFNNSDITANAQQGQAGKVTINASRGVIGLEVRDQQDSDTSDITATSDLGVDFNGEIIFNTPDIDPLNGLIELPTVPLDAEAIFAQNLCKFEDGKIAKGSSFIITGKGGITPTTKNPLGDRDRVVNWANRDDLKVSQDGVVGVVQRATKETLETSDRVIQQAQGWVVTADGSVWLTADNPRAALQNSGIVHPDCRKSLVQ